MSKQRGLFGVPHVKAVCVHEAEVLDGQCSTSADVARIWAETVAKEPLFDSEKEVFAVFLLTRKNQIKGYHVATVGTLSSALVHPREVFRPAIAHAAAAIVVVHNHPSGDPSPSSADIQVTRQLREAARIIGIDLLDHVVIGDPRRDPRGVGHYSFQEAGLL